MALAAVISLKNTLHHLLNSPRISVDPFTRGILEFAHERVESLQEALRNYDDSRNSSEGVMAADARIREHVRQLEDAIELHASSQFLDTQETATFSFNDLHPLTLQIHVFVGTALEMEDEYVIQLFKPSVEKEDSVVPPESSDTDDSGGNQGPEMVGLSDQFLRIRNLLTEGVVSFSDQFIFCVGIIGMPGIGKTTLAKKLFHDPLVKANFECRAFVTVGAKWGFGDILRAIIAQVNLPDNELAMVFGGEVDLVSYLHTCLRGRKFLIMFDGILHDLLFLQVHSIIPVEDNGSGMLLTGCYETENLPTVYFYRLRFLNQDESWELLRKKVFGDEEEEEEDYYCPPYLIKVGKKIAEKCEGLPLLILEVAKLLRKDPRNLEYWEEATKKRSSIFEYALDQIYKVLLPGYQSIPKYLQMNFLYLGAFPQDHTITNSEFGNLWRAEGFSDIPSFNAFGMLSSCSFIVDRRISTMSGRTKACSLHIAYRHLTKREAERDKVFYIMNSYEDCLVERIESHRCLVIHENVLFAIKELHDIMASVATIRSVLCMGPYHQYQVPICSEEWMLLRVLNALTIRFYEFPSNLGKLVLLRYLSLTCNANLHFSISRLWNLQYLIVHPHLSIKRMNSLSDSYLPEEIWDLRELLQLQIIGRNLPDPPPGAVLPKLIRLLDIGVQSCTKQVLQSVPNLEKLRVQIELGPVVATQEDLISCYDHISCLQQLKSFQFVIMNPQLLPVPIAIIPHPPLPFPFPLPLSISTSRLEKLTLKGFGFAWMEMRKLAKLPNLKKLTLQSYAFRGETWDAKETVFSNLCHLCIEDTDLVQWNADDETFQMLGSITIKHCYKLREIPLMLKCWQIELVDCNPLVEACAKQCCNNVIASYSWK